MKKPILATLKRYWQVAHQRLIDTPERALDKAFNAALQIKALEDKYFHGEKVSADSAVYNGSVLTYLQAELQKYLSTARLRLTEFNTSQSVISLTSQRTLLTAGNDAFHLFTSDDETVSTLEKLKFIDDTLARYQREIPASAALAPRIISDSSEIGVVQSSSNGSGQGALVPIDLVSNIEAISDKTGVLPRSILGTIHRIRTQLDPQAEAEVVRNFRSNRAKTTNALRFIILLILIPLLTQQLSRSLIVGPIVDQVRKSETDVFLNSELEEEALTELQRFEEKLRFQIFMASAPKLSQEETEKQLQEKVHELEGKYREESSGAIKNVFADLLATIAFAIVIFTNRRSVSTLKSFMDEIAYGLSDSAKAFIIILFTDMFVGFHSPHGWEVLLDNLARHLGIPASHDLIYLFIATFPVMMDTVFKYWIFRYLNGISPSAVATYKEMNE